MLAHRCRELDVHLEVGTRGVAPQNLRRYLDIARQLGSPILRVVPAPEEEDPDAIVAALRQVAPECEDAGERLALENYEMLPAQRFADIVAEVGSDAVGICLDTTNSLGAGEGTEAVVELLGPLAINLHVKDFTIRRADHRLGLVVEGCPVGRGRLDVRWLLERLRGFGRDPNAILELWTPPEPDADATTEKEMRWATESVRYMRTLVPA